MVLAVAEEKAVVFEAEEAEEVEAEVVGLLSRIGVEEFERLGGAAAIMMPDDRSAGMDHLCSGGMYRYDFENYD